MKNKIALFITVLLVLNGCVAAYGFLGNIFGTNENKALEFNSNELDSIPVNENVFENEASDSEKDPEQVVKNDKRSKIKDVHVATRTYSRLKLSSKNPHIIDNYKVLVAENELSTEEQQKLDGLIIESERPPLTLAFYEFFSNRFFTYDDLEIAEARYKAGEDETAILADYIAIERQFSPTDFEAGKLGALINSGISSDSIIIADILHQRDVLDFDYIMDSLLSRKSWEDIGLEVGLINTTGSVPMIIITEDEVEACNAGTNFSKDEVVEKLAEAKKMELSENEVFEYVQSDENFEDALVEYYSSKY